MIETKYQLLSLQNIVPILLPDILLKIIVLFNYHQNITHFHFQLLFLILLSVLLRSRTASHSNNFGALCDFQIEGEIVGNFDGGQSEQTSNSQNYIAVSESKNSHFQNHPYIRFLKISNLICEAFIASQHVTVC